MIEPTRHLLVGAVLVALVALGACSDGATTSPTTTESTSQVATTGPSTSTSSSSTSSSTSTSTTTPDDEIEVSITPSSIWMSVGSGVDAARVCSPAEPAVAVLDVSEVDGVERGRARASSPGGRTLDVELVEVDGGGWRALVGPLEATRSTIDTTITIEVQLDRADGSVAIGRTDLDVIAPLPCSDGRTAPRRGGATVPGIEARAEPEDGVFVATGAADCSARPDQVAIEVRTRGDVVAVEASADLPDGRTLRRSLRGGPGQWRTTIGDVPGNPAMPERTDVPVSIVATDSGGRSAEASVLLVLARPERCDGPTTSTGAGTTEPGDAPLRLRVTGAATEVYAQVAGACPPGPTTFVLAAETTGAVRDVTVETRTASGSVARWTMTESVTGRWSATVGPVAGLAAMPAASELGVRVVAAGLDGTVVEERRTVTLRRPPPCGSSTTAPATTAPPTTAPSTTAPTTTAPPTTAATTTAPPPDPLSVRVGTPDPSAIDATIEGACPTRPTTFTLRAVTTGAPTRVGVRVVVGPVSRDLQMTSDGPGRWSVRIGPIAGQPGMPDASPISLTVRADDGSTSATASASATLHRPPPC